MITLTVLSFNGTPMTPPLSAQFDETGGNIGRAETNQLVLPDPERTISRVHARVAFRGGAYAIVDQGSNPVSVNGQPVGKGREAPIRIGDRVQIGGYVLQVDAAQSAAQTPDPFADFGGLAQARPSANVQTDPLAAFGAAFGAATAPAATTPHAGIPDDWDPFATTPMTDLVPSAAASGAGARALGLDTGTGTAAPLIPDLTNKAGADSLDQLFGLGGSSAGASGDPLARSPLAQPIAQPNMAAHADPLRALGSLAPASAASVPDQRSELNRPFVAPTVAPPAAPIRAPAPAPALASPPASAPTPIAAPASPSGAVLSWNDGASDGRTIIRAGAKHAATSEASPATMAAPVSVSPSAALAASLPPPPAPTLPAPADAASSTPASSATAALRDDVALLAALREGLAMPDLALPALTPELMRLLGTLLHEAARGTVDLLVARAALKREVRAQVTMIVAKENNPLKFSPSAEAALAHLLGAAPTRGFMPPQRAMRDAYDDLRAHQLAFLAGMRAALEGLLQRFDPSALEGRLTQKSMLSTLLPAARKAQLWSVFQDEYQQIAKEVADDFHQVFGREFLRAYEAQLDALQNGAA